MYIMLTKHEPAPACNHCNEEHVYVVNIMHVMMYVPRSQCSHCIITECMLIDVCFCHACNAGAPGRTVLRTDGVLLGKYDIINLKK